MSRSVHGSTRAPGDPRRARMQRRRRRTALGTALLLSLSLAVLSACGAGNANGRSTEGEVRNVTDARSRSVEIPADPVRIVTLSEPTLDAALGLGITPVGTAAGRGQSDRVANYLPPSAARIPVVGPLTTPDLEAIHDLEPDLILTDGTAINDDVLIGKLQEIAPTLWVGASGNTDWKSSLRVIADALNKDPEAEEFIADFDAQAADVQARLGDNAGAQVSIVRWGLASGAFLPNGTFPGQIVRSVGLTRPPGQDIEGSGHSEQVSLENIGLLDGDWMFFCTLGGAAGPATSQDGGGDTGAGASAETLRHAADLAPGFTDLAVYKAGRVVPVDGTAWGSAGGPLAAMAVLSDISNTLTTA